MPFVASTDRAVAHGLHLVALTGPGHALSPGYAREDAALRSSIRARPVRIEAGEPPLDLADALAAREAPSADAAWFATRWEGGEAESMAAHAARLALEANGLPDGGLLPAGAIETLASPTLARAPVAITEPWRVVATPRTPAIALLLTVIGARLRLALGDLDLEPRDLDLLSPLLAAAALERAQAEPDALDPWLPDIVATWLPAPSDAGSFAAQVHRIARVALDQPPGEVDRIASGLATRRVSRLRRALRRAFFAPAGFDVDGWVASAR